MKYRIMVFCWDVGAIPLYVQRTTVGYCQYDLKKLDPIVGLACAEGLSHHLSRSSGYNTIIWEALGTVPPLIRFIHSERCKEGNWLRNENAQSVSSELIP